MVPLDIHLSPWTSGDFPSAEFELVLAAIPLDIDEICIRVVASRRGDGKKSMSFRDCVTIQRPNNNNVP